MDKFILETFADLVSQYELTVRIKSKRTFSLIFMEDVPYEVKSQVIEKCKSISKEMGRKNFTIDNPYIHSRLGRTIVDRGIWDIRIY
jgi:hypothetical protein